MTRTVCVWWPNHARRSLKHCQTVAFTPRQRAAYTCGVPGSRLLPKSVISTKWSLCPVFMTLPLRLGSRLLCTVSYCLALRIRPVRELVVAVPRQMWPSASPNERNYPAGESCGHGGVLLENAPIDRTISRLACWAASGHAVQFGCTVAVLSLAASLRVVAEE